MNPREMHQEVQRLAEQRGWAEGSPHELYLLTLLSAREEARAALRSKIRALRNDLDHLDAQLKADFPLLNTLGELQGRPAAVEAAIGEFAAVYRALREYLKTFPEKD